MKSILTSPKCSIVVKVHTQQLGLHLADGSCHVYAISTAKNGVGEQMGSECTPRGQHYIRAKIGTNLPENTVLVGRRPTGEIYMPSLRQVYPNRDWILTRIMWLCGLERGKNRFGQVDTMRRYIYIHGSPDDVTMGIPGSRGCIRMHNKDIVDVYDKIDIGTPVFITTC